MEYPSVILTIVVVIILISFCSFCCKNLNTKRTGNQQPAQPNGSIFVTESTLTAYPVNSAYLSSQQSTSEQPVGFGWQNMPRYAQTDSPPSYEEVMAQSAASSLSPLSETYPKQPTQNPAL
ncbi:hypothetical protein Trydic_g14572 [Trypoxylus dichotomus]